MNRGASPPGRAPLVSIITATLNAADLLPYTISSLRDQRECDFEWIVVDGNSSDKTVQQLEECSDIPGTWISEPDSGLYDAWNKACRYARGSWYLFLGAGDALASPDVLAESRRILDGPVTNAKLVYGRVQLLSETGRVPLDTLGRPWEEMTGRWEIGRPALPPHGATFHHASLFGGQSPFDTRYPIAADAKLLLSALRQQQPLFLPFTITSAPMGGVSFNLASATRVAQELRSINRDLALTPPLMHRITEILRLSVIRLIQHLPQQWANAVADALRRLAGKPRRWTVN